MPPSEHARWFAKEVEPYEPSLRAYLLKRFPSLPDQDDLVQETYLRLIRAREKGRVTNVRAFLFTVARNAGIDLFRRRRTTTPDVFSDDMSLRPLEEPPGIAADLEHRHLRQQLVESIARLPGRCREAMILRHVEGCSYQEIASRLGVSLETVKTHLSRGLAQCMSHMQAHQLLDGPKHVAKENRT